ncbi:MAG TPA: PQQ-binding-like beta-propeller repeat protein [Planctomycetota bacterium]|nr:PQQ-binding-like beta-propeller repeat protein [Planctomycetota bacterium]
MTPDDVDALLNRVPPPSPTPQLRDRVLGELARRITLEARRPRRIVWGGVALAMAIAGFLSILWIVLPTGATPGEGRGQGDGDPAFARKVWEFPFSHAGISRLTLLDRLYVEGSDGTLAALERSSGQAAWIFRSDGGAPLDVPPVIVPELLTEIDALQLELRALSTQLDEKLKTTGPGNETQALQKRRNWVRERLRVCQQQDNVYLVSRQVLYCLDRPNGALKWTQRLSFAPSGPPAAIRGYLFMPDAAGARVHALDVEKKGADVLSYQNPVAAAGTSVLGGPVYLDPSLFFVSPDASLHCFRVSDGALVWNFRAEPGKVGELIVHKHQRRGPNGALAKADINLVLFSTGSTMVAMDADRGVPLWTFDCGAPPSGRPVLFGENACVVTEKGLLLSLELLPDQNLKVPAGGLRWKLDGCSQILMSGRKGLYVVGSKQEILVMKESSGEIRARYPYRSLSNFVTNPSDGLLYAVRPGGTIVCFEEAD